MEYLNTAKQVILQQSAALQLLASSLSQDFQLVVDLITRSRGRVILTGIGKSGYIARKIAASFASTGTAAYYVHPAEASHGDLGMITSSDLVIILSNSGETIELLNVIHYCQYLAIKTVAVTMQASSYLAANSNFLLLLPKVNEASSILAPTTSTVMMLSLGDALTIAVQKSKGFSKDDFYLYHPGGKIGAMLIKVSDLMHTDQRLPVVYLDTAFLDIMIIMTQKSLGCAAVVDKNFKLIGIITDGDLRRHFSDQVVFKRAGDLMTSNPERLGPEQLAAEALLMMNSSLITVMPVTDNSGVLTGIVHIHDLLKAGVI